MLPAAAISTITNPYESYYNWSHTWDMLLHLFFFSSLSILRSLSSCCLEQSPVWGASSLLDFLEVFCVPSYDFILRKVSSTCLTLWLAALKSSPVLPCTVEAKSVPWFCWRELSCRRLSLQTPILRYKCEAWGNIIRHNGPVLVIVVVILDE